MLGKTDKIISINSFFDGNITTNMKNRIPAMELCSGTQMLRLRIPKQIVMIYLIACLF